HGGSKCSNEEWSEYVKMPQVHTNETPSEWMKRIWKHLTYFRENNLLPIESKKYLKARKLIQLPNSEEYRKLQPYRNGEALEILCTSNKYCGISYEEYLQKIEKKSILGYDYDNEYALHRYGLWMQNAIKKIEHARKISKKIQAVKVIQQKWLEYFYRPDSIYATELAQHYQLLWAVREKMR
ncbi:46261_t:CDS:2, partial [Gigaspora margarita]